MSTRPEVLAAPDNIPILANGKITNIVKAVEGFTPELQICNLIGTATGQDIFHCIYLAKRHVKNFLERVFCYTIKESEDERYNVEMSFYEWKK